MQSEQEIQNVELLLKTNLITLITTKISKIIINVFALPFTSHLQCFIFKYFVTKLINS